ASLLDSQFSRWEVVAAPSNHPATASAPSGSEASEDPPPAATGPLPSAADEGEAAQSSELHLAESPSQPPSAADNKQAMWANYEPITHSQFERLKRKRRAPLWTVVQIALGGVAAVPIALLLIWHLVGTDVGDAGPLVGKYLPWIVPEKFRPYPPFPEEEVSDEQWAGEPDAREGIAGTDTRRGGFRQFDDVLPLSRTDPAAAGRDAAADPPPADVPPFPLAASVGQAAPARSETTTQVDDPRTQNVINLIRQSEQHLGQWAEAMLTTSPDLKPLAQTIYSDLTGLALVLQELPTGNPVLRTIRDQMQPLGRTVKRRPDVQRLIEQGARFWLAKQAAAGHTDLPRESNSSREAAASSQQADQSPPQQDPFGLALIVQLERVEETADHWILTLSEPKQLGESPLEIHVPRILSPNLLAGQSLFLLGTVEPAEKGTATAPPAARFTASYLHGL
ncbi:MAG: hypothetical protein KDA45_16620, partial [Planctomycetales bacterium]|nr:hypothetical protein [Planctomycetales bacterium]